MTTTNIFEQASRQRIRFETTKGLINTEDLWSLPLQSTTGKINLDDIARSINAKIKDSTVESFVSKTTDASQYENLRLEIVKRVIEVKIAENEARKNAVEAAEQKKRLLEALSNKKAESLNNMTEAQIQAELDKLG